MEKILQKAYELGHLLRQHEIVQRYQTLAQRLDADEAARAILDELIEASATIREKEVTGQPIEVDDKRRLSQLEEKVHGNSLLREFLATQNYYLQLLSHVNDAISNPKGEPPRESNIIVPGADQPSIVLP